MDESRTTPTAAATTKGRTRTACSGPAAQRAAAAGAPGATEAAPGRSLHRTGGLAAIGTRRGASPLAAAATVRPELRPRSENPAPLVNRTRSCPPAPPPPPPFSAFSAPPWPPPPEALIIASTWICMPATHGDRSAAISAGLRQSRSYLARSRRRLCSLRRSVIGNVSRLVPATPSPGRLRPRIATAAADGAQAGPVAAATHGRTRRSRQ